MDSLESTPDPDTLKLSVMKAASTKVSGTQNLLKEGGLQSDILRLNGVLVSDLEKA